MLRRHEQGDFRAFVHRRIDQIRWIAVLHFRKGNLRPPALHQRHQVIAFGDQAFELQVGITLLERAERRFEAVGLISVGKGHSQFRLDPLGELAGGHFQTTGGGQNLLGPLQHHAPGRRQPGFAAAAVEQRQVEVDFQAGHCRADGRLTTAQLARGGGKRTLGGSFDKRQQHFMRGHELSP
ncbi:hypothetical protein D3C87_1508570 [compost metagenome]